jgi:hypothetical protein
MVEVVAWEVTTTMSRDTVSLRRKWMRSSRSTLVSRRLAISLDFQELAAAESIEVSDLAFHQDVAVVTVAHQMRLDLAVVLDTVPIPPTVLDQARPPRLASLFNARMCRFICEVGLMQRRLDGPT